MFHCGTVPGHVDGLDGTEGSEGNAERLLTQFKVDTANVYTDRRGEERRGGKIIRNSKYRILILRLKKGFKNYIM